MHLRKNSRDVFKIDCIKGVFFYTSGRQDWGTLDGCKAVSGKSGFAIWGVCTFTSRETRSFKLPQVYLKETVRCKMSAGWLGMPLAPDNKTGWESCPSFQFARFSNSTNQTLKTGRETRPNSLGETTAIAAQDGKKWNYCEDQDCSKQICWHEHSARWRLLLPDIKRKAAIHPSSRKSRKPTLEDVTACNSYKAWKLQSTGGKRMSQFGLKCLHILQLLQGVMNL